MGSAAHAHNVDLNNRPEPDRVLKDIATYVANYKVISDEAFLTARYDLMDSLACMVLALKFPDCMKLLGPVAEGAIVPHGARVPGTKYELDPVKAAFDIGTLVRWLDYNDTWLAAEWGHPSDNLGAILGLGDYLSRRAEAKGKTGFTMREIFTFMIKAFEIQGCMALENSFNRVGLDHVILVKVASAAVAMHMMDGTYDQIVDVLSHAFVDGHPLRTYRHAPNAGPRKSWAAGDATSRAVRLAQIVKAEQIGYPSVLTAPKWGFYDVLFKGNQFKFQRPFGSYVMESILFKISYPAEFHSQTAVECAVHLHPQVKDRLDKIEKIILTTHEAAIRIISKTGPLHNFADRDHCLQYMVAVPLIKGNLTADDYSDEAASDPRIEMLRGKMEVVEDKRYSQDYHEPDKRSIANAMQIFFKDGSKTEKVEIEYPIGHRRRRADGFPLIEKKFEEYGGDFYGAKHTAKLLALFDDPKKLDSMRLTEFMGLLV